MKEIKLIIEKRNEIVIKYCKEKGWPLDPGNLTIDQVMEIRSLEEWKNVTK